MANIYQISQELLSIFDELEENGGELTPELEEQLNITREEFKDKIKSYSNVVKMLENDIIDIKSEKARLNDLQKSKEKTIERLKKIMINAVELFGNTTKSGSKYLDYGTGKVSIRNTQIVEIEEDVTDRFVNRALSCLRWYQQNNQLDTITSDDVLEYCNSKSPDEEINGDEITTLSEEDIAQIKANIDLDIPVSELLTTEHGMKLAKALAEYDMFTCKAKISKTEIKANAKENHTMPVFAKLVDNQTLTIK